MNLLLLIKCIFINILHSNFITQPNKTIKCSDRSWFIGMVFTVATYLCVAASLVLAHDCKGHEVMNFLDTK